VVRTAISLGVVGALVAGLGAVQLLPEDLDVPLAAAPAAAATGLQPYDGCAQLLEDYRSELRRSATPYGWDVPGQGQRAVLDVALARTAGVAVAPAAAPAVGTGPTGTNVQEAGVDEPDLAKLAGGLLVTVGDDALQLVRTGRDPVRLGRLPLERGTYGAELLLDGDRALVVIPDGGADGPQLDAAVPSASTPRSRTVLRLADLSDPREPRWLERWEVDGAYVSARLVDGTVRLVTRSVPEVRSELPRRLHGRNRQAQALHVNREAASRITLDDVLPRAVRTDPSGAVLSDGPAVSCDRVSSAPRSAGAGLLLVSTLRPGNGLDPLDGVGVRSDGDLVYAAADRLVVGTSRWATSAQAGKRGRRTGAGVSTELHAFDTSQPDSTRYVATGSVPGYVYGRWALSQHEGALRVVTTSAPPWQDTSGAGSQITVLQERGAALVRVGSVGGLGRGEQVKAVRYLGDLAAVVTFRQTDPLHVLDLGDPAAPRLLGELEVPGYSAYLHPVGDDRLLGIGLEGDALQAQLFDLSDRTHPARLSRLTLGRPDWTALEESRAFAYDPVRRLAVLPARSRHGHGAAVGVRVGQDGRLQQVGSLPLAASALRVLSDGDRVYAVTERDVVAADADSMQPTGSVAFR